MPFKIVLLTLRNLMVSGLKYSGEFEQRFWPCHSSLPLPFSPVCAQGCWSVLKLLLHNLLLGTTHTHTNLCFPWDFLFHPRLVFCQKELEQCHWEVYLRNWNSALLSFKHCSKWASLLLSFINNSSYYTNIFNTQSLWIYAFTDVVSYTE